MKYEETQRCEHLWEGCVVAAKCGIHALHVDVRRQVPKDQLNRMPELLHIHGGAQ